MRRHLASTVAVTGTAAICGAAFLLSFAALADLATRSGVTTPWLWPGIVDGLIVVATVAVVAGAGRYAWLLLIVGALVSVAGNVLHAALPDGPLPVWLRATVAAVPPVALVAVAHLAVVLRRAVSAQPTAERDGKVVQVDQVDQDDLISSPGPELSQPETPGDDSDTVKARALELLTSGHNPRAIADQLGVHRATVYRWRQTLPVSP